MSWEHLYDVTNDKLEVVDRLRVCAEDTLSSEGFRLLWFHSTRKAKRDARSRGRVVDRVIRELANLQNRLQSSRTRFRQRDKVEAAVKEIFSGTDATRWLNVHIREIEEETFKQTKRGRPGKDTQYIRQTPRETLSPARGG